MNRKRRRVILYGGAGVVVALMLGCHHFALKRPPGRGSAGPVVPRAAFGTVWSERRVMLLGLGDSITAGFGASPGKNYFERLAKNPEDEWAEMRGISLGAVFPNLSSNNRSQSGSTSLEHLEYQVKRLPVQAADVFGVVVMTTGGNDIIHAYGRNPPQEGAMYGATSKQAQPWIENFEKRLEEMLDAIARAFPGGHEIFLANIYDPTDGRGTVRLFLLPSWPDGLKVLGAYNEVIARVAARREDVHLVDLHKLFMGHGITCAQFWRETYQSDDPYYWYGAEVFEDPNDRGYDATRRAFLLKMAEVGMSAECRVKSAERRVQSENGNGNDNDNDNGLRWVTLWGYGEEGDIYAGQWWGLSRGND